MAPQTCTEVLQNKMPCFADVVEVILLHSILSHRTCARAAAGRCVPNTLPTQYGPCGLRRTVSTIVKQIVKFDREESGRRHLRSSTTNAAVVMRTRTQFRKRAFTVCGPTPSIWNRIPPQIRNLHSAPAFREALKTYLFSEII